MTRTLLGAASVAALLLTGTLALAEQKLTISANKTANFWAAVGGVTRLSVEGDRIRKLVHDDTGFETMNDEETGDVFMRYVGDQSKLVPETGHIITESGATIAYEIKPRISSDAETVVISISGDRKKAATDAATPVGPKEPEPFFDGTESSVGGGYSDGLVEFTRKVIVEHIGRKAPPKAGKSSVIASERAGGLKAKVLVASGGAQGGLVRAASYYTPKVVAVWVDRPTLGPNERTWVVVVERVK